MVELPDQWESFSDDAKRVYLSQALTQRQQLQLLVEEMGLDMEIDVHGPLTNVLLGQVVTEILVTEVTP